MRIKVNRSEYLIQDAWRDETLLYVLREQLGLVGAKFGCGQGDCGACTVHVDGSPTRSCQVRASDVETNEIVTIEGLSSPNSHLHPVQQAWLDERVAQCGYCQAGQIMQAVALLAHNPKPDNQTIAEYMRANLCRCGTQSRVRKAIKRAGGEMREKS
jgi:isoquinoline 1-oxidoreductase alpha subunit